jgi:hypothetical protein
MKELFLKGINFQEFLHNVSIMDTGDFHAVEELIKLPQEDIDSIQSIKNPCYILAIAEGWCIDCKINLTLLNRIVNYNDGIKLSIISLEEGKVSQLQKYQEDERLKIPTFIFMDENFNVFDYWIEAPLKVKQFRLNKDERHEDYLRGKMLQESKIELLNILV